MAGAKTVIVTGASQGIGGHCPHSGARPNNVVATARSMAKAGLAGVSQPCAGSMETSVTRRRFRSGRRQRSDRFRLDSTIW